jgi:hypothetical protein
MQAQRHPATMRLHRIAPPLSIVFRLRKLNHLHAPPSNSNLVIRLCPDKDNHHYNQKHQKIDVDTHIVKDWLTGLGKRLEFQAQAH